MSLPKNLIGLFTLVAIWLIFSFFGLRGHTLDQEYKTIRQNTGISLLTLSMFVLGVLGLIALIKYF